MPNWLDELPRDAPWPSMTRRQAARYLGVDPQMIASVASKAGPLRHVQVVSAKGNPVRVYCKEDVHALGTKVRSASLTDI